MKEIDKSLKEFIDHYVKLSPAERAKSDKDLSQVISKMGEPMSSLFTAVMEYVKAGVSSDEITKKFKGG
ncbi:MAG: hypothetical protein V1843_03510 [bacterium]